MEVKKRRKINTRVALVRELYYQLKKLIDSGIWWPAESRFEIFIGAILTQNTAWTNVEKSLNRLKSRGFDNAMAINSLARETLIDLIRTSGFMTAKSANLQNIAGWFLTRDTIVQSLDTPSLRQELLMQPGVGEETADALLLYAYRRPVFIYDSYARRILEVIGLGSFKNYAAARKALNQEVMATGFSSREFAEFHGLIIEAGKMARKKGKWPLDFPFKI